jgi:hypothetical protein
VTRQLVLRNVFFFVAIAIGYLALATLDAWRPSTSVLDRLGTWTVGFGIMRAFGVLMGAPILARKAGAPMVTPKGLVGALPLAVGNLFVSLPLLLGIIAPALIHDAPTPSDDLILGGISLLGTPCFAFHTWLVIRAVRAGRVSARVTP